ncbi:putative oxidoreductase [Corynebacterium atrinae]|nr:putative oxidoreductase [Corynebacterium atrinae]
MGNMTTNSPVKVPSVTLNDGTEMPQLGLGTWNLTGEDGARIVREAIAMGYRHIDTASIYHNEEEVGQAIREAIAAGDVTREELFVTSKLWNDDQGEDRVPAAFQESLHRLGLEYLDLYLVHWPAPSLGKYLESYEAIARLQGLGVIQSIGVSNFYEEVLHELIDATGTAPAVNQVELHPGFSQAPLRQVHEELGILTEAWSPLGRGAVLADPVLDAVARDVGKTTAQVALRWEMQLGCSAIPKSTNLQRLEKILEVTDFSLNSAQMDAISDLDHAEGFGRIFDDPRSYPSED